MFKVLTQFLVKTFIPDFKNTQNEIVRARYGFLQGALGTAVNLLLFATKLTLGLMLNSLALLADSFDSLSDTLTTAIVIISFKISKKPADEGHPYGHGRAEYIATLIISIVLIISGIEFFKSGIQRLTRTEVYAFHGWVIAVILMTIVIKIMLSQVSKHLSNMIGSDVLRADFLHHRTDALSSLFVIVALILTPLGYPWIDAAAALIVACLVIFTGARIAWGAIDTLLGKPPTNEYIQELREMVKGFPGVLDAHDIVVHSYGQKKFISLHIEVSDKLSTMKSHDLSEDIEEHLARRLHAFSTIHIDPVQTDNEGIAAVKIFLTTVMAETPSLLNFHDLRIVDNKGCHFLFVNIVTKTGPETRESEGLKDQVARRLKTQFPQFEPVISVAPFHILQ